MAYCKYCGMESKDASKCDWCGRQIDATEASVPAAGPQAAPAVVDNTPQARLARMDEAERLGRQRFFIGAVILLVVTAAAIFLKYQFYFWIILAAGFAVGYMLRKFEVVEPYADDLLLVGLLFIIPAPMFFVLVGLIAYGVIQKDLNYTFVWLMASYLAVNLVLITVTALALLHSPEAYGLLASAAGLDKLGFLAVVLGWRAGGTYS